MGYDNQEFVSYLTNKGFNVNHKSYSNYDGSLYSITSTFNMRYLNFLIEDQIGQKVLHIPEKMIAENTIMQNLGSKQYTVTVFVHIFY